MTPLYDSFSIQIHTTCRCDGDTGGAVRAVSQGFAGDAAVVRVLGTRAISAAIMAMVAMAAADRLTRFDKEILSPGAGRGEPHDSIKWLFNLTERYLPKQLRQKGPVFVLLTRCFGTPL